MNMVLLFLLLVGIQVVGGQAIWERDLFIATLDLMLGLANSRAFIGRRCLLGLLLA